MDTQRLCNCGCGRTTTPSRCYRPELGIKPGDPLPFLRGHSGGRPGTKGTPFLDRFWARVKKSDGDGCWEWTGKIDANSGYARTFGPNGRRDGVHRLSWIAANGQAIPSDREICHRCDNRICVRPDHLFLGTRLENAQDKVSKGRAPRGSENAAAKLTEAQVLTIRTASHRRGTRARLAREHGVSVSTIKQIWSGAIWTHVQPTSGGVA